MEIAIPRIVKKSKKNPKNESQKKPILVEVKVDEEHAVPPGVRVEQIEFDTTREALGGVTDVDSGLCQISGRPGICRSSGMEEISPTLNLRGKVKSKKRMRQKRKVRTYYQNFDSFKTSNQRNRFSYQLKESVQGFIDIVMVGETNTRDKQDLVLEGYNLIAYDRISVKGGIKQFKGRCGNISE